MAWGALLGTSMTTPSHSTSCCLLLSCPSVNLVLVQCLSGVTINNIKFTQTKPRDPKKPKSLGDGHWGVHSGEAAEVRAAGGVGCRMCPAACRGAQVLKRCMETTGHRPSRCPFTSCNAAHLRSAGSAADVLVDGFVCDQGLLHVVGADAMSLFAVFSNGRHGWRPGRSEGLLEE